MINPFLLSELEALLGSSTKTSKDNYSFICPFCNHSKKKLEIDLLTSQSGENRFACWVCGIKGRTLKSLLIQLRVDKSRRYSILKYIKKSEEPSEIEKCLFLPKEFKPLNQVTDSNFIANKAKKYLYNRGLTEFDIHKYNIGYCGSGEYGGRIIVPSYDSNNILTFFIGRSFQDDYFKYKNPSLNKDALVFFENTINWELPVVLVEGVFDAIAIKRNAIPLLGKSLPNSIFKKLLENGTKEVYVALDQDAKKQAFLISSKLFNSGINSYLVELPSKDPGEMHFSKIVDTLLNTRQLTNSSIIKHKLNL